MPEGLRVEADLRWEILQSLVALGAAGSAEIDAELNSDRTATGEREAALARALIPTAESKAETWRRLVRDHALPNWLQRALLWAPAPARPPHARTWRSLRGVGDGGPTGGDRRRSRTLGTDQQVSEDTVRRTEPGWS